MITTKEAFRQEYGHARAKLRGLVPPSIEMHGWKIIAAAGLLAHQHFSDAAQEFDDASTNPVPAHYWWAHEKEQRDGGYTTDRSAYRCLRGPKGKLP